MWGAVLALFAAASARAATAAHHQDPNSLWVDILDVSPVGEDSGEEVEKRYTAELEREVGGARGEALLLYTEFQARAAQDMKAFSTNITHFTRQALNNILEPGELDRAPAHCAAQLRGRMSRAVFNAQRAAAFSAHNHHKFFLGHMIVFRMHLNKSEEYIKKCKRVIEVCGPKCETTPKVSRWRQLALAELSRVRADVAHARAQYGDLLAHALRRLRALRRHALASAQLAARQFRDCAAPQPTLDTTVTDASGSE